MAGVLELRSSVGKGQENDPEDVFALDSSLRQIGAYSPPPEYREQPQYFMTGPVIAALERFQEQKGIKIDGYARPGGPSERAINNSLLEKPRGAGLLLHPPAPLVDKVGSGHANDRTDVQNIQRMLGGLGYMKEDPFDRPHGFIDDDTVRGIRSFQKDNGLQEDGWLAPQGETEAQLNDRVMRLSIDADRDWRGFWQDDAAIRRGSLTGIESNEADGPPELTLVRQPTNVQIGPSRTFGGSRLGLWPERIPQDFSRMAPPLSPRTRGSENPPRVLFFTNPGSPTPSTRPPNRDRLFLGYTDEYDYYQWIDQQQRIHTGDRSAGISIPGNERPLTAPPRSGFQGIYDIRGYQSREFDGRAKRLASEAIVAHRGNEFTRQQNYAIVEILSDLAEKHDCKVRHSAGSRLLGTVKELKEMILPRIRPDGSEDKHSGSARPDIVFEEPTGKRLFINTVDRLRDLRPSAREERSALRILENSASGDILLLVPKLKLGESLNLASFRSLLSELLDKLCSTSAPDARSYRFNGVLRKPEATGR